MSIFHHEEQPNPSRKCKCLASILKEVFANFHSFRARLTNSGPAEEDPTSDFDAEEEEVFVSAVISKYMELKCKRKSSLALDSFNWALSPRAADISLSFTSDAARQQKGNDEVGGDEFLTVGSHLSGCSSDTSMEAFFSAKTCFSPSSSLSKIHELPDFGRRSIILELIHCEGWPFGLCKRALLLPPLPKSPSDSWLWRKNV